MNEFVVKQDKDAFKTPFLAIIKKMGHFWNPQTYS